MLDPQTIPIGARTDFTLDELAGGTRRPRIAVLIPCYNEERSVGKVIVDFKRACPEADVFVFDNNSDDQSARIAREAGAKVIPVRRQGKGNVVRAMLSKVSSDIYVMVDGDDTYPAEKVQDMIQPVLAGKADMVTGSRLVVNDKGAFRPLHQMGNKLFCRLVSTIFGAKLRDVLTGYRVFNASVAKHLPVVSSGFEVEAEMTIQCLYYDFVIDEIDVPYRARPEGNPSKLNTFRDGFRILLKIAHLLRAYKPLTFFGGLSVIAFGLSLGIVLGAPIPPLANGDISHAGLGILLVSLVLVGGICTCTGVILHTFNYRIKEIHSVMTKIEGIRVR